MPITLKKLSMPPSIHDVINRKTAVFWAFSLFPLGQLFEQSLAFPIAPHLLIFTALSVEILIKATRHKVLPKPNISLTIYIGGLFYCLALTPFADEKKSVLLSILRQIELISPYFILLFLGGSKNLSIIAAKGFVIGNILSCIFAISLFLGGEVYYGGRLTYSAEYNPTVFGANIAFALILTPLALYKKNQGSWHKLLIASIACLLLISLILSQSRNALLSIIFGGIFSAGYLLFVSLRLRTGIVLGGKRIFHNLLWASLLIALLSTSIWTLFRFGEIDQKYFSRLTAFIEWSDSTSATANRDWIWEAYLNISPPIFGFGFDNTETFLTTVGMQHFPHNSFILAYMQGGIILLSVYLAFFSLMIRETITKARSTFPIAVAGIYLFMLNFGNDVYQYSYFWVPFAIIMEIARHDRCKSSAPA